MDKKREAEISEIAGALGLSATTVSRAISGKGRVSEDTKSRILSYIEENQIAPHIRTTRYSDKKTMNIAVVLPKEKDYAELPYFTRILMTLCDFFAIRGYHVMVIRTCAEDIGAIRDVVKKHKIDGAVLTRILENNADIEFLRQKEVPFVVIGSLDDDAVYQADVDQRRGCHDLTDILIKKGIRKMALFCSDLRQTVSQSRMNGYLDAIRENDLPIEYRMIFENSDDTDVLEKSVGDVLKAQVECVICSDDGLCIALLDYLRKLKVAVPDDLRVASFFNSMILEEANSSITSIDFDIRQLGKTAGSMLMRLLDGEPCEKKQMLGYNILLKDSTKVTGGNGNGLY